VSAPALPAFVDGTVVHQGPLNDIVTNINILADNTAGKRQAAQYLRPKCTLQKNATQSIASAGTPTLISWTSANTNTDNMWVGSQANQVTIQTAGLYALMVSVIWLGGLTTSLARSDAWILVNGTGVGNIVAGQSSSIYNGGWWIHVATVAQLAAGAVVYFGVDQNSGSSGTLDTNFGGCQASATFLAK
jgi:hypothetical protein